MDHLDPRLAHVGVARVVLRGSGGRDVAEAAGPVGTAEARIREARVAAQHHDAEAQERAQQREAADPELTRMCAHTQPMCESLSSFLRSLSRSLVVWLGVVPHHEIAERIDDEQRLSARSDGNCASNVCALGRRGVERDEPGMLRREVFVGAAIAVARKTRCTRVISLLSASRVWRANTSAVRQSVVAARRRLYR